MNLLGGPAGAGKSLFARDPALSVATGTPWRGYRVVTPRQVLWVASEGLEKFEERWGQHPLWHMGKSRVIIEASPVNLLMLSDEERLVKRCVENGVGLVVFDVIYGMGLPDDNGTKDVLSVIDTLKRISAASGAGTQEIPMNQGVPCANLCGEPADAGQPVGPMRDPRTRESGDVHLGCGRDTGWEVA